MSKMSASLTNDGVVSESDDEMTNGGEDESMSSTDSEHDDGSIMTIGLSKDWKKDSGPGAKAEPRVTLQYEMAPKSILWRPIQDLGPSRLDVISSVEVASVLEELSDKLNVISNSIDTPPIDIRQDKSVISDMALHRPALHIPAVIKPQSESPVSEKWLLTQHYRSVIPRRLRQGVQAPGAVIRQDPTYLLRLHGIKKFTEKGKIQANRTEVQVAVDIAVAELVQNCTFQTFMDVVAGEEALYQGMSELVQTSVSNAEKRVQLKRSARQVRRDKKSELTAMDQEIYQLHDATQEMVRRKELEGAYVRKGGDLLVKRSQKMCEKMEHGVETDVEDEKLRVAEEYRCHEAMVTIIDAKLGKAEELLEQWMERYETDKENLQNELDNMKASRERDLKRMAWLKHMIANYSQICHDDRRIKDKMAEEERLWRLKNRKSIRIQAWWRGEMVRKQLGPFRPVKPKKKSGKKK